MFSYFEKKRLDRDRKIKEDLEDKIIQGEQVRNFFATDLGKYIEKNIEIDIANIKQKLTQVDPELYLKIIELQTEYKVLNRVKLYFAKAIIDCDNALQALDLENNIQ